MTTEKYGAAYDYCGIVFISGGSSWHYGASPDEAATQAAKTCKRDWKHLFKFKRKQEFSVCIYDTSKCEGWYAHSGQVFDRDTKEELPLLEVINVTV